MEDSEHCPICNTELRNRENAFTGGDYEQFDCPRCGRYKAARSLLIGLGTIVGQPGTLALLSHTVRKMQASKNIPFLNTDFVQAILKTKLPSLSEQCINAIMWLGDSSEPGQKLTADNALTEAIIGAGSFEGTLLVFNHLFDQGFLTGTFFAGSADFSLAFKGWQYYDEIKRGAVASRRAFMAMKYGDHDLEWMFENSFSPAVEATGFHLYRLDKDPKPGLIDDQLRVEIRTSRFLISDLTFDNGGAYWEAGYAEGLGKPVIYICESKKFEKYKTHFDTNHQKTFTWDRTTPDVISRQLKATIRATLPDEATLTDQP